jgi:hypothetical protein
MMEKYICPKYKTCTAVCDHQVVHEYGETCTYSCRPEKEVDGTTIQEEEYQKVQCRKATEEEIIESSY